MRISRSSPIRSISMVLALILFPVTVVLAQQSLQTPCELSGFERYTTYEEMMTYLQNVQAASTEMRLSNYGTTYEGRELPFAVFSRPSVRQPWEALVSGKPIVLLAANVHGGERTLRESLLIMVRELATSGTPLNRMLDDLVILVAPSLNPDGFEATPRGTRGNAWGIDLNRDYAKLEQQALANYVGNLSNTWHPHIVVDGHNGGSYPYNICYLGPSHAAPSQLIAQFCDQDIFPFIDRKMEASGYRSFYYSGGNETEWRVGGSDPRISRNYIGFTNNIGILFESPGRQGMETGVKSGAVAYQAMLEFATENPSAVMELVSFARQETVQMGDAAEGMVPVQQEYGPEDFPVTYQTEIGPRGGERELITVTDGKIMKKPVVTAERERPWAYLLPREAREAVELLKRHGIAIEVLQDTVTVEIEAYTLESVAYQSEYGHTAAVNAKVGEVLTMTRRFPKGTYVVPTGQVLGRVVTHLLEPETNDNVVHWNTMDAWLPMAEPRQRFRRPGQEQGPPPPKLIPIFKVMSPTPMPTKVLNY